jgi:hypothetical protein
VPFPLGESRWHESVGGRLGRIFLVERIHYIAYLLVR